MQPSVKWFEIPVSDLARAAGFYGRLFDNPVMHLDLGDLKMGLLAGGQGALVQHPAYVPSHEGALLFFDGGNDLAELLDRVEPAGGKVIRPKTQISPEQGFMGLFEDSEGNRLGLRSQQ
ncbi:VOC family protein [Nibrella viscosa]|uniref:VOC family protein n=2 Tax=Nibrella viscosa TaxID=1084524 RepID=A0ABP8KXD3_9BACT